MKTYTNANPRPPKTMRESLAVAIAMDVIAQLAAKKYVAKKRRFVATLSPDVCEVCAIGAVWTSLRALLGMDPEDNGGDRVKAYEALAPVMNGQCRSVEIAFEGDLLGFSDDEGKNGRKWVRRFPKSDMRLRKIMQNLIRNGGQFKIEQVR
jgi:hypothetical protein